MPNLRFSIFFPASFILAMTNCYMSFSQNKSFVGKSYTTLISSSCKLFNDGGCTIDTYCILSFENDKVDISYKIDAKCSSKEREKLYEENSSRNDKKSTWFLKNSKIHINDFDEFGDLEFTDQEIVGTSQINGQTEKIIFKDSGL